MKELLDYVLLNEVVCSMKEHPIFVGAIDEMIADYTPVNENEFQ